ncbi:carbon-nitrogen family hydrolase [Gracilibacillus salitolerans]|uniref:Carbon-nitrogen family hydrolase n=1 Tax=Gracilibacillus salitolerans TaxID=2663022 RepID=A0A5Q2TIE9_9BACI|nr:carbon-nitrogen family hydrolase [Gracilibacillus salitolerans]QGH33763.1 carbon-nitrogen family hydrolase [Gracilibacillus salitolerans]
MKYAIYQMDVVVADPEANREKIKNWIEREVDDDKPDTVVLPEMWNAGYALDRLDGLADNNGENTIPFLSDLAKKNNINIIGGSIANQKENGIYNTSYVFNREGKLVHHYDKMHLVPMLDEPKYLNGGEAKGAIFELEGVKMGVIICYDLRFPELMRAIALQGAEVLHIVAQWPTARKDHWKFLQYARAIENQCYVISANSSGSCNGTDFAGESMVINPSGELVASGLPEQESTISASIDLTKVAEIRKNIPVFDSRVPHLYGE